MIQSRPSKAIMSTPAISVEIVVYGYIRQNIESNKSWNLTIPDPIKVICKQYHGLLVFTESNILNIGQQFDLWKLLSQKIKFQQTKLLYNALRDGFTITAFFDNTRATSPTVIIAHTNYGNICGVFTTFWWQKTATCSYMGFDKYAFLWLLNSDKGDHIKPQIFDAVNNSMVVDEGGWHPDIICKFGDATFVLFEHCNIEQNNVASKDDCFGINDAALLCGGNQRQSAGSRRCNFGCVDIEVFQIKEPYEFV